ncbi:GATOR complex protein WDR24-like isoform X3 [Tigriopus californicus]|uniref:GATOR complex protein WDR24-like isoform X3 n=1 Tax=Tigriopus californicus TaxID=6832 RepID=UPI0027DA2A00|nr:GATOR complex protein WDR24-like isoform X3 [Tigriopus californicus]
MGLNTFYTGPENAPNALDINRENNNVVIAGRNVFKVFAIGEFSLNELFNLRAGRSINLNYSCNDVAWSVFDDNLLATAATNGAVVLWNLGKAAKSKPDHIFTEHKRTVNKVSFHPSDGGLLLSGSQDGTIRLFDVRTRECVMNFSSGNESIRDAQFCPLQHQTFASAAENGRVSVWDIRKSERPERAWNAHTEYVFACDWHPECRNVIATAGRDKTVKVWNLDEDRAKLDVNIQTIGPVGRIKWRPNHRFQIASSALALDFSVHIWDVRRPWIPTYSFDQHKDVTTDFLFKGDSEALLSTGRDGLVYHHAFKDCIMPIERTNPNSLAFNVSGDITLAFLDKNSMADSATLITNEPAIPLPPPMPPIALTSPSNGSGASAAANPVMSNVQRNSLTSRVTQTERLSKRGSPESLRGSPEPSMSSIAVSITSGATASGNAAAMSMNFGSSSSWKTVTYNKNRSKRKVVKPKEPKDQKREVLRGTKSKLKLFHLSGGDRNPVTSSTIAADQNVAAEAISLLDLNPDLDDILTDNNWFITCAQNYIFSGESFAQMCDHNAEVAKSVELEQISVTWDIIKILTGAFDFTEAEKSASAYMQTLNAPTDEAHIPAGAEADQWMRNASSRLRHMSGIGSSVDKKGDHSGGPGGGRIMTPLEGESDNDSDESQDELEGEDMLANIASGQMLGDYRLSNNEDQDLFLEEFVYPDMAPMNESTLDWKLRTEAFEPRHELNQDIPHDDAAAEQYVLNGMQTSDNQGNGDDDPLVSLMENVTVEDQTSHLLSVPPLEDIPMCDHDPCIRDTLIEYAELGDVQHSILDNGYAVFSVGRENQWYVQRGRSGILVFNLH